MGNQSLLNDVGLKISNREYREHEGISSTDLKKMAQSPAHFRYWKDHPQEDTPALLFGRAAHKYMLEKDDFFNEFAVAQNIDRRTKAGKEEWSLFVEQSKGKDIISSDDFETILEMHKALYDTPFVSRLLSGVRESSYFNRDEKTGLIMKCRPDCLTEIGSDHLLIDYKTCSDASSDAFMKDAIKLMYDLQMAYYKDNVDKKTGFNHGVVFIAQEKKPPYLVNVLEANEYFIKSGRDMYRTYLDEYADCLETCNWYGYMKDGINTLGLPNWLQKQYEV